MFFSTDTRRNLNRRRAFFLCGTGVRTIEVRVYGRLAGRVDPLMGDGAIMRYAGQGLWCERERSFDASLLKQGPAALKLTTPAGPVLTAFLGPSATD